MKNIFKQTKVVYDDHSKVYKVYYKNWFRWIHDRDYRFDENTLYPVHYCNRQKAEERALDRAKSMLNTVEVWRSGSDE